MIRSRSIRPQSRRRGAVAVLVALLLAVLMGITAIAIDGGVLLSEHRHAQAAADASAMAAACVLYANYPNLPQDGTSSEAEAAALSVAQSHFPNNPDDSEPDYTGELTVEVNIPPKCNPPYQNSPYKNARGYAEVIITYKQKRFFSRLDPETGKLRSDAGAIPVTARAVARGAWTKPNIGVLILDYDDQSSLNAQGNGAFTETGGPVIVNSNNPNAFVDMGNGTMIAESFHITGGLKLGSSATLETQPEPNQIFLGEHPTPDPLAYLPEPTMPPLGTITETSLASGNKQYVLTPGTFTNLPQFNTGDVVIFQQASAGNGGIYYINGGGFKSTGATIMMDPATSGGMMLYNNPQSTAQSEKLQITGNSAGSVILSPLTDGPYSGMMIWQDRDAVNEVLVEGNGEFTVKGTFYAAGAKLNVNGNGGTTTGDTGQVIQGSTIGSQYISNNLSLGGNGNVHINYFGPAVARVRILTLVE